MLKGYYLLTSSVMTQKENLNIIGNNIANVSTTGFRRSKMVQTTFKEELLSRTGNLNKSHAQGLGIMSKLTIPSEVFVDFRNGSITETERNLDYSIMGKGFFKVQRGNEALYTRNGSFNVDGEGYLEVLGAGRVLGQNNQPIRVGTDKILVDSKGNIQDYQQNVLGKIGVFSFENTNQLENAHQGFFRNIQGNEIADRESVITSKTLERSNVEVARELTDMIVAQRSVQSSAQIIKTYDQIMEKAAEISRI